jgi:MULE transposase domain/FLYWCH zinc finger domain
MNNNICEIISSIRGQDKINVNGYIMVKDKNRNDSHYWCCEKRVALQCNGRATTKLVEGQHCLQNVSDHNHAAEASRVNVIKTVNTLKGRASETSEPPAQIIQTVSTSISHEIHPYLPSRDALRQSINRIRSSDLPTEPDSLGGLIIPEDLTKTLDGSEFLVRDSVIDEDRILLFTTIVNVRYLEQSSFWIMDGTFKTVPTIFRQLYTIHGRVGGNENSRIMPLVYALMSRKSEGCYRRMLQDLIDFGSEYNINLQPQFVLTDFEQAAINATSREFQGVQNKGCFFHLAQSIYRRIQTSGLSVQYGTDENFSLLIRHIPALAFLPPNDIPAAFDELKGHIPPEANEIVEWFENNYVHGRIRRTLRDDNVIRASPLFPPVFWSVIDNIEYAFPRTQNSVEAWHRRWETLVGVAHLGVFKIIKEMQKEQNRVQLDIESILRGAPRPSQRKENIMREIRIQTVFNDRDNRSLMDFLRGIAHNVSL